ncbi:peptidoglycan editing factor PgeF [Plastoroseomonas arctica]|uniref:Purine nucleoside phosphorylase n=1 Tax=Plastoroseomonas arctica TaxID=1509237 RepID=A0AAF1JWF0_9PROT|nr:peptidoglycan editing factor PgeF [Plastoroseomonas arctica]MBR0655117.1 peptidoglycan editing factor PgeF [Plastoroseomonas arctica]
MTLPRIADEDLGAPHGFFTRQGGVSEGGYASLNCSTSGADDPSRVAENRARVAASLGVAPGALFGVRQVHGVRCAVLEAPWDTPPEADALATRLPAVALGVVTADCGPVLFADSAAGVVAAAHAGWRGAVDGVLEATVAAMVGLGAEPGRIMAVVGPCIRQPSYEVAADLRDAVLARDADDARFFADGVRAGRWQFDLAGYCAARLAACGVNVRIVAHDTLAEEALFFSHRRRTLAGGGAIGHQISAIAGLG